MSNNHTPEMSTVITVVRAILTSAPKDGLNIRQVMSDYQNVEGHPLPFRKFGYTTLEEFLQASNGFILKQMSEGIRVTARESRESAHINRLVKQQNHPKKKSNSTVLLPRRPVHVPSSSDNKWRSSAFSDIYSRLPNRSVKKAVAASAYKPLSSTQPQKQQFNSTLTDGSGAKEVPKRPITKDPIKNQQQIVNSNPAQRSKIENENTKTTPVLDITADTTPPVKSAGKGPYNRLQLQNNCLPRVPYAAKNYAAPPQQLIQKSNIQLTAPIQKPSLNSRLARFQNNECKQSGDNNKSSRLNNRLTRLQSSDDIVDFMQPTNGNEKTYSSKVSLMELGTFSNKVLNDHFMCRFGNSG